MWHPKRSGPAAGPDGPATRAARESLPVGMFIHVYVLPVVHASTLERVVGDFEAR
jgi:hypothetical protein